MSGVMSCRQCGCSEVDTDPSRGDTVCTSCGYVLEESIIVSEITFEEDGHGVSSAIGQFVSSDSRGGGGSSLAQSGFHSGITKESREITLKSAKRRIVDVAQQLRLNQHCVDVAFNFFKMALHKQLTKGRRHPLTIAACVYMTCRMEGTPHLLIDFCDVVQMDVYALGRAYVQISRALYINIPSVDPCLYILRFAHKFGLGPKTHEVSVTALRLVQRMKRDWIHFGRRPSGLCGAALLIAARIHGFSRTVQDVINIVKVHETTLRRRLIEFGETPSSSLTMDEFMSVDLEEEHDPPAFKAARVKDRDQLSKMLDEVDVGEELSDLQVRIESELERRKRKRILSEEYAAAKIKKSIEFKGNSFGDDSSLESSLVDELTRESISDLLPIELGNTGEVNVPDLGRDEIVTKKKKTNTPKKCNNKIEAEEDNSEIHPIKRETKKEEMMSLVVSRPLHEVADYQRDDESVDIGELDLTGIDDNEIDGYLMNEQESERKRVLWEKLNSEYIENQEKKQAQMEEDLKNGRQERKKKIKKERGGLNKDQFQAKTANEAIKIMLEKKLSSKINYDVLKSLTPLVNEPIPGGSGVSSSLTVPNGRQKVEEMDTVIESGPVIRKPKWTDETESSQALAVIPSFEEAKSAIAGSARRRFKSESENIESLRSSSNSLSVVIDPDTKSIMLKPIKGESSISKLNVTGGHSLSTNLTSSNTLKLPAESEAIEREVVVETGPVVIESGPVQYADEENYDEDYDEDDYEDGEPLTASQLLNQFRGERGHNDDYEDYLD